MKNNLLIKSVYPELDGGKYDVKIEVDRLLKVEAVIENAEKANLKVRKKYERSEWQPIKMIRSAGGRWKGEFKPGSTGYYEYTVEAFSTGKAKKYKRNLGLVVDPVNARYAAWYEMFPRSQGRIPGKSSTFKDCKKRLGYVKKMGFDVIYFPPIHPIGRAFRKGPNNTLNACPDDPGCPWAIGNENGGHKSVHPELGTLEDFRDLVKKANSMGIEIALDIALNCSPDHPYIKEHPNWFFYRDDGTIRYAENPPKKYQDTYPLNFNIKDPQQKKVMWNEMKSIFIFWAEYGVRIFRIDNPHTKPTEFWAWLIKEVKKIYPESIFLAEAFTSYDKLELLARAGFNQSYSYFTWRNEKNEIIEYFTKLTGTNLSDYLRVNLFCNTPDINPHWVDRGGAAPFKIRCALASTLSSVWAIYSGFELCEHDRLDNKEEYNRSEKYEFKVWDWNRKGNIKKYISRLNRIRRENKALHLYDNLKFLPSTNDNIICYNKNSYDMENIIIIAVSLSRTRVQSTRITIPLQEIGLPTGAEYAVTELITDRAVNWKGEHQFIMMNPQKQPAYIFRIEPGKKVKKPVISKSSEKLAKRDGKKFYNLLTGFLLTNDPYKKIDLDNYFLSVITPKVYFSESYKPGYLASINNYSKKMGYDSIIDAFISIPGK